MQNISSLFQIIHQILSDPAVDIIISSAIAVTLARQSIPVRTPTLLKNLTETLLQCKSG
jgi:hypothetical protein